MNGDVSRLRNKHEARPNGHCSKHSHSFVIRDARESGLMERDRRYMSKKVSTRKVSIMSHVDITR